jgi:hypothetical protein
MTLNKNIPMGAVWAVVLPCRIYLKSLNELFQLHTTKKLKHWLQGLAPIVLFLSTTTVFAREKETNFNRLRFH